MDCVVLEVGKGAEVYSVECQGKTMIVLLIAVLCLVLVIFLHVYYIRLGILSFSRGRWLELQPLLTDV
jgi:hypothetical protein